MNIKSIIKQHWRYLCISPLFLTAILTAFIQYHSISFLRIEILLVYALLTLIGISYGALIIASNTLLRSVMMAIIVSFFVLSQLHLTSSHIIPYRYTLLILLASTSTVFYLINRMQTKLRLDTLFILVFSVYWAGAFFTKPLFNSPFLTTKNIQIATEENKSLPPYIHIVLDEHTSFDAIPYNNDSYNKQLESNYIGRGFHIYPNAYSRENFTVASFSSFLNFKPLNNLKKYYQLEKVDGYTLLTNQLFEQLSQQGYQLNIIQSTYLNFCKHNNKKISLKYCLTYHFLDFVPEQSPLMTRIAALLNGVLSELKLEDMFRSFQKRSLWKHLGLNNKTVAPLTPASAVVHVFPEIQNLLKTARNGNAYFIHLLIPHIPFVMDKNCNFVGVNNNLLQGYKEQIQCSQKIIDKLLLALSTNPATKNSIVIIHGDHGIRMLGLNANNKKFLTNKNLKRTFSVLFAVKSPFLTPGTDTSQLPLDALIQNIHAHSHSIQPYPVSQQYFVLREDAHFNVLEKYSIKTTNWDVDKLG
ncbi:MAG: sulfatase-like hydrolase/transferase [Legionella sp.]|uniref:sulfatase-like hydrolase/transferase n=1 Tax=Legionella sp. TaxID=459 RepID=UPI002843508C|nr:sulfatase-like hydrolase/transferase [Legionella sp.]